MADEPENEDVVEQPAQEQPAVGEEHPASDLPLQDLAGGEPFEKEEIGNNEIERPLSAVYDVPVQVAAVLGHTSMQVSQLLKMGRGAVIELDRKVGEAIDVYVNNRLVARGEVVVVDDHLGVTMTEIIRSDHN